MVEELASLLENFPGAANQTRCFLHILNLTAKSILQQFEIPKKKNSDGDGGDGDDGDGWDNKKVLKKAISELQALSKEIEEEENTSQVETDDVEDDDNEEGLEDERQDLTEEQIAELEADLMPVRLMLTKVCSDDSVKIFNPLACFLSATSTVEHNEELVNTYSSSMEHQTEGAQSGYSYDAARRCNAMEFDFRYDRLFNHLPFGS